MRSLACTGESLQICKTFEKLPLLFSSFQLQLNLLSAGTVEMCTFFFFRNKFHFHLRERETTHLVICSCVTRTKGRVQHLTWVVPGWAEYSTELGDARMGRVQHWTWVVPGWAEYSTALGWCQDGQSTALNFGGARMGRVHTALSLGGARMGRVQHWAWVVPGWKLRYVLHKTLGGKCERENCHCFSFLAEQRYESFQGSVKLKVGRGSFYE